jgi:hypothetical protein
VREITKEIKKQRDYQFVLQRNFQPTDDYKKTKA